MFNNQKTIEDLKLLGLNSYEAKLWLALLSRGSSSAGELSNLANVPRSRSYDVLESLEKKGFIVVKLGKPIQYVAIKPTEALDRVKKQKILDLDFIINKLNTAKESNVLKELSLLYKQGIDMLDPFEISGSVKGRSNLYSHISMLLKSAEKSVVLSTTKTGFKRKIPILLKQLKLAKKRGVKIRISTKLDEACEDILKSISNIATVKDLGLDSRFVLIDDSELVFMLKNDKEIHPSYDSGIWVNSPFFTESLINLFDRAWHTS